MISCSRAGLSLTPHKVCSNVADVTLRDGRVAALAPDLPITTAQTSRVGSVGAAAVLDLQQGEFTFVDAAGNQVQSGQRLAPVLTVQHGQRWRQMPV